MNPTQQLTLAIESAIRGGSVSLIVDGREIDNWIGATDVSKAEDLLADIDAMLSTNGLTIRDVSHVAVSAGPGSFTGIRIGIATALGLKTGLGIPMSSISALEAIALNSEVSDETTIAVPVGRNAICQQRFGRIDGTITALGEPDTIQLETLASEIGKGNDSSYVLHRWLYEGLGSPEDAVDFGENMAFAIGIACGQREGTITEPLFISKSF